MPMNSVESPVNRLTSSHTDPVTNTPAFKETSVHLNVLPEVGETPLPRVNSRFGHPTPQQGVEVERKWKRSDYTAPGNGLVHYPRVARPGQERTGAPRHGGARSAFPTR